MAMGPPVAAAAASSAALAVGSSSASSSPVLATRSPVRRSSSAIEGLLEWRRTDPAPGGEEVFAVVAVGKIGRDDGVDGIRHGFGPEARADDGADRGVVLRAAAERNLVELGAFLVDAENANIAGMVMPAGVDAAGHVEAKRPDQLLTCRIFEALGDLLGDRDRAGIGEVAIVEARTADHVAQEMVIAGGKPLGFELVIDGEQISARDVGQDEVLGVVHPRLVPAVALGEIGNEIHLVRACVAGSAPRLFERDDDAYTARHAMRPHIV